MTVDVVWPGKLSAKLHPSGWGWLISHRKLLVWNYKISEHIKVRFLYNKWLCMCMFVYVVLTG